VSVAIVMSDVENEKGGFWFENAGFWFGLVVLGFAAANLGLNLGGCWVCCVGFWRWF